MSININEAKDLVVKAGIELVESELIARTWGNVSCRLDENSFVITPSGREYTTLKREDVVKINMENLSYEGNIKPSSEKGIHKEVYKIFPNINFVIHTHQQYASVISALGINSLNDEIICADYGLPGTKKLKNNVVKALKNCKNNALIMKYHGALCFGETYEETFKVALELENTCREFIIENYLKLSKRKSYDPMEMAMFALNSNFSDKEISKENIAYHNSSRTEDGMIIFDQEKENTLVENSIELKIKEEENIHNQIYYDHKDINHIIFDNSPEILAIAKSNIELKPLLDDFAQIGGVVAKNIPNNPILISKALKKSSVVFIENVGALCCGKTKEDAEAVRMVTIKASKALVGASLFKNVKPINPIECRLMRYVYLNKYSKKALEK